MKKKLKLKHSEMVRTGNLLVANRILRLLKNKRIILGYSDIDNETELILDRLGVKWQLTQNNCNACFYLTGE